MRKFARKYALALAFAGVFALIGGITLLKTHAAATPVTITGIGSKCLDNNQNLKAIGNKIQLWGCNGGTAQDWTINNGTIVNTNGYCLDVSGAGVAAATLVQLWGCNGGVAQQWVVRADGSIMNPHSGMCLDAQFAQTQDGTQIWIWGCNGGVAQKWTTHPVSAPAPNPTPTPTPTPIPTPTPVPSTPTPLGVSGAWTLAFSDDFTKDSAIDQGAWAQTSAAESQCGQGNHGNGQAEWNQGYTNDTLSAANGLSINDKRQTTTNCNDTFTWTGGLLASKQAFQAGDVIEEKFQFPANVPAGGWPSFWTWCSSGANGCEVDAYEGWPPHSNGNGTVVSSDHIGGGTTGTASVYVSVGDWHTVDVVVGSHDLTWYLDGKAFGTAKHSVAQNDFNLILDNDVCDGSGCPAPSASTNSITENVSYVRVWKPAN